MDKLPTLDDIKTDLLQFEKVVTELKKNNEETYDSSLNVPYWRARNTKDFAFVLGATSVRFSGHMQLLAKANDIIDDQNINKKSISNIGKKLMEFVAVYQHNVNKSKLGERLLQNLNQLDVVLRNYSRPDAGIAPRGPGR
jgi:hypothetical protein